MNCLMQCFRWGSQRHGSTHSTTEKPTGVTCSWEKAGGWLERREAPDMRDRRKVLPLADIISDLMSSSSVWWKPVSFLSVRIKTCNYAFSKSNIALVSVDTVRLCLGTETLSTLLLRVNWKNAGEILFLPFCAITYFFKNPECKRFNICGILLNDY